MHCVHISLSAGVCTEKKNVTHDELIDLFVRELCTFYICRSLIVEVRVELVRVAVQMKWVSVIAELAGRSCENATRGPRYHWLFVLEVSSHKGPGITHLRGAHVTLAVSS